MQTYITLTAGEVNRRFTTSPAFSALLLFGRTNMFVLPNSSNEKKRSALKGRFGEDCIHNRQYRLFKSNHWFGIYV